MEYIYAALLLHSSGKDVSEDGIKTILDAAGISADEIRVKALVAALEGVDIESVLSQATVAPVAAAAAPAAAATGAAPEAKVEEAEEESEEEAEESGIEGLGALFG